MLVSINTNPASESNNNQTRFFNFMASLYSVATCAAGGTPTAVRPVKSADGTKNTNFNCITVISNTEAGGWSAGVSNNITPSTAYNASASSLIVDLYNASGKSSYPYFRQTFSNFSYSFASGNYDSYPQLEYIQGATSSDPSSVGHTSSVSYWDQGNAFRRGTSGWTSNPPYVPLDVHLDNQTVYVAVTSNYLIITTPYCMAYFGVRDQAGWELTRVDNPPWVVFGFCGRANNFVNTNDSHWNYYQAWSSRISPTGTQVAPSKLGAQNQYSTGAHMCTGQRYGSGDVGSYWGYAGQTSGLRPLFSLAYASSGQASYNAWAIDPPTTDTVTGLSVPPAYPLIFQYSNGSSEAASGRMPGMLKGMASTAAGLNYTVTASEYSINGEAYVPIRTGHVTYPDLFFLRKA